MSRRSGFQFSNLLVEVFVKMAHNTSGMWLSKLVAIEIDKQCLDIVHEFVDPGKVEE